MWIKKKELTEMSDSIKAEIIRDLRSEFNLVNDILQKTNDERLKAFEQEVDNKIREVGKKIQDWCDRTNKKVVKQHEGNLAHHKLIEGWLKELRDHIMKEEKK